MVEIIIEKETEIEIKIWESFLPRSEFHTSKYDITKRDRQNSKIAPWFPSPCIHILCNPQFFNVGGTCNLFPINRI